MKVFPTSILPTETDSTCLTVDEVIDSKKITNVYPIVQRHIDTSSLSKYLEDSEFYFDRTLKPPVTESLFAAFANYFKNLIAKIFEINGMNSIWKFIKMIVVIGIVLFGLSKLFGMEFGSMFFKSSETTNVNFRRIEEDINEIDFNTRIKEAIEKKNYRMAIRLYYLKTLKALEEKEIIKWRINKTNADYINEVASSSHSENFNEITRLFDYVWYGEFHLDHNSFEQSKARFENFIEKI